MASCHGSQEMRATSNGELRVLLMGNPNVGKSAVFSRLTGAHVVASNYPGTTVSFTQGYMRMEGRDCVVIDVPGTYTLEPTCRAEEVAVEMLDHGDVLVNVLDSTNLERNLNLTLQLIRHGKPMIMVLNMWDEAQEHGIRIDTEKLSQELGVPVVTTCAISGEGMGSLRDALSRACQSPLEFEDEERWNTVGAIVERCQRVEHRHPSIGQRLSHATVHPLIGPFLALLVLFVSFEVVRFMGEGLINHLCDPLFNRLWLPVCWSLSDLLGNGGTLHDLLIGELIVDEGERIIDFGASFGVLTTGLYIPLAAVLPYVLAFYFVLGILEDTGYLPRLGVLVDNVMHKLGLHGLSIVPMLLGLGCNVPGALSLRVLETRKERFITATLLAICIPCVAQIAMISVLVAKYGAAGFLWVFGSLFVLWVVLGTVMNKLTHGTAPEILMDIPPYRMPFASATYKKLWMRMKGFFKEAIPYVLLGVLIVNVLYSIGVLEFTSRLLSPLTTKVLGLPGDAVGALVVGFLRKDVSVGMLRPLQTAGELGMRQTIVACFVLAAYFPCFATFVMLVKELGVRDMIKSSLIMVTVAFGSGAVLNVILRALGVE